LLSSRIAKGTTRKSKKRSVDAILFQVKRIERRGILLCFFPFWWFCSLCEKSWCSWRLLTMSLASRYTIYSESLLNRNSLVNHQRWLCPLLLLPSKWISLVFRSFSKPLAFMPKSFISSLKTRQTLSLNYFPSIFRGTHKLFVDSSFEFDCSFS
jgi:hypothetical protein